MSGAGRYLAHTRALTVPRPIRPTSRCCPSARQPNPGTSSTYRCGKSVQTIGATASTCLIFSVNSSQRAQLGRCAKSIPGKDLRLRFRWCRFTWHKLSILPCHGRSKPDSALNGVTLGPAPPAPEGCAPSADPHPPNANHLQGHASRIATKASATNG
jgi:hypothetical protein